MSTERHPFVAFAARDVNRKLARSDPPAAERCTRRRVLARVAFPASRVSHADHYSALPPGTSLSPDPARSSVQRAVEAARVDFFRPKAERLIDSNLLTRVRFV